MSTLLRSKLEKLTKNELLNVYNKRGISIDKHSHSTKKQLSDYLLDHKGAGAAL